MKISKENFLLNAIYDDAHRELNPNDDDCWNCGGEGFLEGECTCGEDTCCCLEPEAPPCPECRLFDAKIERYVRVQVLRAFDIPLAVAWARRKGRGALAKKMDDRKMLANLHAGRVACGEFSDQERADSACWVEGLL
jgi:hypothetical protein